MVLERLSLTNFKNYKEADVQLCGNINCFVGNNGAGKTNLLDAVYYLSFCKSCFNPIDSQNILQGADYFAIHGHYDEMTVSCVMKRDKGKAIKVGNKACKTLAEHIGKIPLVMVSPYDQSLITGGSEGRRRFVDGILSQIDHQYLEHLMQYGKALEQRNRLLKQMWEDRIWDEGMVTVWDVQLCRHGSYLYSAREAFMVDFLPIFGEYYQYIAGSDEPWKIVYSRVENPLEDQLDGSRQADKYSQYTNVGPHKDDFLLLFNDEMSVKKYGSQGQQKSFSLALKLSQFQYLYNHCGCKPILLLDDIFDKLDHQRVRQLVDLVGSDRFGQVLLTDTQQGRVQALFSEMPMLEHALFNVSRGEVHHAG